ncbi:hypothetical protein K2173_025609 [Erythroxylum novogranatense]|uniref:DUF6821 domain-containing protein n=1 Tax=Erythroxylum novogranatense TaxID=1862640 RepID=A0AAV8TA80_9ROSI|nr:hypothetical protein K2173_025609 [Erythroxylum novogranatense]
MDLDEWELLPREGFRDYREDEEKGIIGGSKRSSSPKTVFNMNYFVCPSSPPRSSSSVPNHLAPVPIQLEPASGRDPDDELSKGGVTMVPIDISKVVPSMIMPKVRATNIGSKEADQDPASQVFFKKMKEHEFVDMKKLESPKSPTKGFAPPQIEAYKGETLSSPRFKNQKEDTEEEAMWEESSEGLNIWKWSFTGIGAICTFGIAAAATICVIILGSHQKNSRQNQNFRIQIYSDDKRIKQGDRQPTRLNEAISTARGVPAHITIGGYYNGL